MDVRFTVGEFAKLCGLPKQTLIFYDKEKVLCPKYKDSRNGYRYYTAEQLEQMDSIMILREMGFSLQEIRDYMQDRSLENSLQLLENQRRAIHQKINQLMTIERRINKKAESLQMFCKPDSSFRIRSLPAQLLAVAEVRRPAGLLEVDIALKQLMKQVRNSGTFHFYQVGDIVSRHSLSEGDFLRFQWAFLPIDAADGSIATIQKPAGEYAVQCHFGPYETMGQTYREMLTRLETLGREIAGNSYEFCVLDSLTTSSPENYCTQIQIPIR